MRRCIVAILAWTALNVAAANGLAAERHSVERHSVEYDSIDASFLAAVQAVIEQLDTDGWGGHAIQVDPRPIPADSRAVSVSGFVDAPEAVERRTRTLEQAGLEIGDMREAEYCNHVGGMGGLMIPPLTESQKQKQARCAAAFRGLTFAVSLPASREEDANSVLRVLVFGSDAEMGWDVTVDPRGEVVSVRRFMRHIS